MIKSQLVFMEAFIKNGFSKECPSILGGHPGRMDHWFQTVPRGSAEHLRGVWPEGSGGPPPGDAGLLCAKGAGLGGQQFFTPQDSSQGRNCLPL